MVRTNVMTVMRCYAQDKVYQEESEHNEVDGMKKGVDSARKVMQCDCRAEHFKREKKAGRNFPGFTSSHYECPKTCHFCIID